MKDYDELSKKEKIEIINVVEQYAEYLSENGPQVDETGFNYYFAGSLASMLYASAREIQYINIDENKVISDGKKIEISEETRESLIDFGRKIGDIDIVQVGDKTLIQDLEHPVKEEGLSFSITSNDPYISLERYVKKQIPNIDKLYSTTQLRGLFGPDAREGELNGLVTNDRVCKLTTNSGKIVYVASPETIIAHKLNKAIGNFGTEYNEKKDARDLALFVNGILKSYDATTLKSMIVDAWKEMKYPININEKNEKDAKTLLAQMYKKAIIPEIKNEEDKESVKIIGIAALEYINYRTKQIEDVKRKLEIKEQTANPPKYTTKEIGKATIDVLTEDKLKASQIEKNERYQNREEVSKYDY